MEVPKDSELEDFERWDVPSLKTFLAKRGVSRKGKKKELVALAYSCNIMNKPVDDTYNADIQQAFRDYEDILHRSIPNGITIPDPFKIQNGWIGEEKDGMRLWPPISIVEIMGHLRQYTVDSEEMLSDYKNEKAYDYFKSEWLKEILYNTFDESASTSTGLNNFCILKASCTPSQRLHDPDHGAWIVAEKKTGKVACAYCNCAAG